MNNFVAVWIWIGYYEIRHSFVEGAMKRVDGNNPTIGIVLCSDTDEDIAKYSVLHGNEQLFASKYKLYLPTEEELRAEIETQKEMFYLQRNSETDR